MLGNQFGVRRFAWVMLAGAAALLLTVGMLLWLFQSQALAEPAAEIAALTVSKEVSKDSTVPGDRLAYTITVGNPGLSASDAWMTDSLPVELSFVTGSLDASHGEFGFEGGVITWTHNLPPGAEGYQITFQADITSEILYAEIVNTAQLTASGQLVEDSATTVALVEMGDLDNPQTEKSANTVEFVTPIQAFTRKASTYVGARQYTYWFPSIMRTFPPGVDLDPIPVPDAEHRFTLNWTGPGVPVDQYVVQMASSPAFGDDTKAVWTTGAEAQVVRAYCPYYYRVRADNSSAWGQGAWSNVEQGHASAPVLTLNPVPEGDPGDQIVVSWSAVEALPGWDQVDRYLLQEAKDPDFNTMWRQWQVYDPSVTIEALQGTWYYRVRADDNDCWGEGPSSNVQSLSVLGDIFFDDFSDPDSGWPVVHKTVIGSPKAGYHTHYETDSEAYRIRVDAGGPDIWFYQPDALAPYVLETDKYCVEVDVRLVIEYPPYNGQGWDYYPYWSNGGLVFGANEENTNLYALCTSVGDEGLNYMMGWFVVNNPEYDYPKMGCNHQDGVKGGQDAGVLNEKPWHLFQVGVDGDYATIYIDGVYKRRFRMSGLSGTTRVGLIGGDYEITPVDYWFDNFRVIPNAECTPPETTASRLDRFSYGGPGDDFIGRVW